MDNEERLSPEERLFFETYVLRMQELHNVLNGEHKGLEVVLTTHLILEQIIIEQLEQAFFNKGKMRWGTTEAPTFFITLRIAYSLGLLTKEQVGFSSKLMELRNKFSHNLNRTLTTEDINVLRNCLHYSDDELGQQKSLGQKLITMTHFVVYDIFMTTRFKWRDGLSGIAMRELDEIFEPLALLESVSTE